MEFTNDQSCSVTERNPSREAGKSPGGVEFEGESLGLEVLVVHEDSTTALRAKETLNNLENLLELKIRFVISLCGFDMFADPGLAESALQQAKRSDIVFLSLLGDRKLPNAVRNWLLRWLETRDFKPCALVVSLDSSIRDLLEFNSTWNFLRTITAPLEVDLFLHWGVPPAMARRQERLRVERDEHFALLASAGKRPLGPKEHSGLGIVP